MSSTIADGARLSDGIVAATHKLVQQAMTGQWQDVPKTVQERRELLDEVNGLLHEIRSAWLAIAPEARAR